MAADRLAVEVDSGSATSWERPPARAWLVRLRSGERSVIVAWGLSRSSAEDLAERIAQILCGPRRQHEGGSHPTATRASEPCPKRRGRPR